MLEQPFDGNPLRLLYLMNHLRLGRHCDNCAGKEVTWSSTSRPAETKTSSSSIRINFACCALDSVTLLDARSLFVRPRWQIPEGEICLPEVWLTQKLELLRTMANTTS